MEWDHGSNSNPFPEAVDKSRVLDVRPLRCLVPVFPNSPETSSISTPHPTPFVCVSPSGPFPAGVQPFYPLLFQTQQEHFGYGGSVPAPVPLNSFRTPASRRSGGQVSDDDDEFSDSLEQSDQYQNMSQFAGGGSNSGKRSRQLKKKQVDDDDETSLVNRFMTLFKLDGLNEFKRTTGDSETVATMLLVYNLIRKRLTQIEEARGLLPGVSRRPDLKTANLMMTKGLRTNSAKRIGHVPGVEIGDIFFFRMELCIIGLHAPTMAGIDYMTMGEEVLADSIVSSGGYDDVGDDSDVIIYTGQGGVQRRDRQMFDQKLERGNLALENSLHRGNEVRVIRGIKDTGSTGKIYVYDGLYKIKESWGEKNKSGCNVFKYKLVRVPGQPESFSLWKSIQQWKDGTAARPSIILPDLTSGVESQPVALVNEIDDEKGPSHFTYISNLKYSQPFTASNPSVGCQCKGGCQPGDTHCPCNRKNDGFLPYSPIGVLLSEKTVIHECGMGCACSGTCRNRMTQSGIKAHLEIFKTKDRGWGLRSWDPIRAGGFICEFAGDIVNASSIDASGSKNDDCYIFDATRSYSSPLEPGHAPTTKTPYPLVISAKNNGNVARFMNHCCTPNVFWRPVLRESNNDAYLHIAFFAIRHIPPMAELTYDYGMVPPEKGDTAKKCLCGSKKCRGTFV